MAIGASRMNVMTLVLSQSLKLALIGAVIGFAITLVVERLINNMIYAIRPRDPLIFFAVACFIVMTSILAAYIPAHRASRIEPLTALRED
jgi:ABC-type lipoprotein release transport system permease subunit